MMVYTGLDSCEENLRLTSYIRCLKPIYLEYVEYLHLTAVLAGEGTVVRWSFVLIWNVCH